MWQDLYELYVFLFGMFIGNLLGLYGQVDLWVLWKQRGWPFTWYQMTQVNHWLQEEWQLWGRYVSRLGAEEKPVQDPHTHKDE